jgi:hypothetical protein
MYKLFYRSTNVSVEDAIWYTSTPPQSKPSNTSLSDRPVKFHVNTSGSSSANQIADRIVNKDVFPFYKCKKIHAFPALHQQ